MLNQVQNIFREKQKTAHWMDTYSPVPAFDDLYDLDKGLHKLPDNYRVPLVMYYYVGLSIKEIAQQLDVSTNTIKIRLSRGRKKLRIYLKETW